jgi:Domain of unknown function (DUF4382)
MKIFKRQFSSLFLLVFVALVSFIGCQKSISSEDNAGTTGKLTVFLTDHQSLVFDSVFVEITGAEIKVEDNGVDSLGGWFNLNITPGIYNLMSLRNGVDTLLATAQLPVGGKLQKIRLSLGTRNRVVRNGQTFPLALKRGHEFITLKLDDSNIDFLPPNQYQFWLDFDAGRSIREENGVYVLRPVIKAFCRGRSGRIEGKVLPRAAGAVVYAIKGTDTVASARPEDDGEYKIVGLDAGTYRVYFNATTNNYRDTAISNVIVRTKEDTKLGTITLRQ